MTSGKTKGSATFQSGPNTWRIHDELRGGEAGAASVCCRDDRSIFLLRHLRVVETAPLGYEDPSPMGYSHEYTMVSVSKRRAAHRVRGERGRRSRCLPRLPVRSTA